MELNAETVKEWLEICAEDTPYPDQSQALLDALALITSQEQRIKELTEENERLREDNNQWTENWADNQRRWENLYRQLKIENEMLLTHIPIPKEMLEGEK